MMESDIKAQILNALRRLSFVRVDRYQTGMLPNPVGQMVSFGAEGGADIIACVAPIGRMVGLECKRPGEKQTLKQLAWATDIQTKGGFAHCVDNLDSACDHVMNAYWLNLRLAKLAGEITEDERTAKWSSANAEMAQAKRQAAEAQVKRDKRRQHMPTQRALPPGTNRGAGI